MRDTPYERLKSLPMRQQRAFLALFAGARHNLQGARLPDGRELTPAFGKSECKIEGWRDFFSRVLPALGLTTFRESETRPAPGMAPGSVVWDIYIGITADGLAAQEAYWAKLETPDA